MALTPEVRAPQAGSLSVFKQTAQRVLLPQGSALAIYNIPANQINVTYGDSHVVYKQGQFIRATYASTMAVVRGKIDNPKLRAWYYTLDGHDFYILKLGTNGKTLVFDLTTKQWSWWSTSTNGNWRASIGLNWRSSGSVPSNFGSNVIVGDDSSGALWVLDPEYGLDGGLSDGQEFTFPRIATAQMISRDRKFIPIYSVYLTASLGNPAQSTSKVTLSYSDDQGHSYVIADEPMIAVSGDYAQEFSWLSMGQVRAPGRLFQIEDDGAFARIDELSVNE